MTSLLSWFSDNVGDHLGTIQKLGGIWLLIGVLSFLFTLIALPVIIIRLPADYFVREERLTVASGSAHPLIVILANVVKNVIGLALVIFGAVMLFIPGQGVLTMLMGLMLTNFPGKYRLEQRIVKRARVLRTLNSIRRRAGRDPLIRPIESPE